MPNAIAFVDPSHGILGTGWLPCADNSAFGCRPQGTISSTRDGGRTWRVVLRTARPVVSVSVRLGEERAVLDDGENLVSTDGGRRWAPASPATVTTAPCTPGYTATFATAPAGREFALCSGSAGAGNQNKAVYRLNTEQGRWQRVAWTPWQGAGYGGLSIGGYPVGIAMADDGFGLIWESRGTLYVTRDDGSQWIGLPKVARPEVDFGDSGAALDGGIGFVLLSSNGGTERRRLLVTRDSGRTWSVVHRWT